MVIESRNVDVTESRNRISEMTTLSHLKTFEIVRLFFHAVVKCPEYQKSSKFSNVVKHFEIE